MPRIQSQPLYRVNMWRLLGRFCYVTFDKEQKNIVVTSRHHLARGGVQLLVVARMAVGPERGAECVWRNTNH